MARIRKDNDQRYLLKADGPFAKLDDNGKLDSSVLPALAITETFIVANTAERLALSAQTGDIAIQSDNGLSYILYGTDPSVAGDWIELTSVETDPVFTASPAFGITSTNITQWNTAYGWGDHASEGYLVATTTDKSNWNTAYGWGNHAGLYHGSSGISQSDINTNLSNRSFRSDHTATGNPTSTYYGVTTFGNGSNVVGQLAVHFQDGTSYTRAYNSSWSNWRRNWSDADFTSTNVNNWDTAYGWGNHASAGYGLASNDFWQSATGGISYSSGNVGIGSGDPLRPFYVEKSNDGDWVAEIYNTHVSNGYGLKVRAGDDTNVHAFYVTDVSNTGLFTVRGGGNVGIGNANPQRKLSVHEAASGAGCWAQFTNASTGTSSGAGTLVGIDSSSDFRILNYEATRLRFYTSGTDRMQVNVNGSIHAASNTGASYLMWLTNSATSAGQGQVLRLDASGRSTGTKDIDVFEIQNADGRIHGVRNDGQTYMQATQSSPIKAKTTSYPTVFGVLPWSTSTTYLSSGVYYDNNTWVHASGDTKSCLLELSGNGVDWYASSNSSSSWDQASNVQLWDASGQWTGFINTSSTANVGGVNSLSSASTNSSFAGTASSTYVAFKSASTTIRGYIGNGPGLITGSANSDFIVRSQAALKFGVNGNNLGATLDTGGNLTTTGAMTSTGVYTDFMRIEKASGTIMELRDTDATSATSANIYLYFQKSDGGNLGYIGYGSNSTDYMYFNNQQGDVYIGGNTIRLANQTICSGTFSSTNLTRNLGDFGSIAATEARGGYYGFSCNGHMVLMSNGSAHGIYDDINNDWWVRFFENAGVDLNYNGAAKLSTTSAGVSVTGSMTASGEVTAFSDARLKSNVQTLDGSKVYQMRGVSYDKQGVASSGVIAQELQEVAPELVHEGEEYLSVAYGNMVGYLIEAVKQLNERVKELEDGNTDKQTSESVNGSD